MKHAEHAPLPVFIITKSGTGFSDDGIQAVRDFVLDADTSGAGPAGYGIDENTTGIFAMNGAHLLNPSVLAEALRENPTARVVLSMNGGRSMTMCGYGPDRQGLPGVIETLEHGSGTSWEILTSAINHVEDLPNK